MKYVKITTFSILITICLLSAGQIYPAKLTVTVMDSLQPMSDAVVVILEQNLQETTDKKGKALFEDLTPGKYTLVVMLNGYHKYTKAVTIPADGLKITAKINPKAYNLGEVTISAKRTQGKTETKTTITQDEVGAVSQSIMHDSIKALQAMPGVSSSGGTFDSRMYIQGGDAYEWIASMDGVYIMNPTRWGGSVSMFNPNIVDTIDLYTAGYPSSFGQGLSGIVDVQTRSGDKEHWKLFYEQSVVSSEIQLEGPVSSNFTVFFNTRRTYYDLVAPYLFTGDQWKGVQFPYLWDGVFKMNWEITPSDILSFTGYGSQEGMKWNLAAGGDTDLGSNAVFSYQTINLIGSLRYRHNFGNEDSFDITAAYTPIFGNYHLGDSMIVQEDEWENDYYYQLSGNYYLNSITNHKIQIGTLNFYAVPDGSNNVNVYSLNQQGQWTNSYSMNQKLGPMNIYYNGIYAMDNWEFIPSWIVQFGVRGEYYNANNEYDINPQAGLKYEITKKLDVFFRTGIYDLLPVDIIEIDPTYGNPKLVSQKVQHYITGFDFSDDRYAFKLEGFVKNYYDLVENDIVSNYNNNGIRNVYGGDVYLQKKAVRGDWLSGWISYTYTYGMEKITARSAPTPQEIYQTPLNEFFVPGYLRNHTLSAIVDMTYYSGEKPSFFDFLEKWKLSFDYRLLSGSPYTPVTNFTAYQTPAGTQYLFAYGQYNSEFLPWYSKLDIRITMPYSILSLLSYAGLENFENNNLCGFYKRS